PPTLNRVSQRRIAVSTPRFEYRDARDLDPHHARRAGSRHGQRGHRTGLPRTPRDLLGARPLGVPVVRDRARPPRLGSGVLLSLDARPLPSLPRAHPAALPDHRAAVRRVGHPALSAPWGGI